MKKIIGIIILIFLTSCSFETNKDKQIVILNNTITNQKLEIEKLQKKNELNIKIEKAKTDKNKDLLNYIKYKVLEKIK